MGRRRTKLVGTSRGARLSATRRVPRGLIITVAGPDGSGRPRSAPRSPPVCCGARTCAGSPPLHGSARCAAEATPTPRGRRRRSRIPRRFGSEGARIVRRMARRFALLGAPVRSTRRVPHDRTRLVGPGRRSGALPTPAVRRSRAGARSSPADFGPAHRPRRSGGTAGDPEGRSFRGPSSRARCRRGETSCPAVSDLSTSTFLPHSTTSCRARPTRSCDSRRRSPGGTCNGRARPSDRGRLSRRSCERSRASGRVRRERRAHRRPSPRIPEHAPEIAFHPAKSQSGRDSHTRDGSPLQEIAVHRDDVGPAPNRQGKGGVNPRVHVEQVATDEVEVERTVVGPRNRCATRASRSSSGGKVSAAATVPHGCGHRRTSHAYAWSRRDGPDTQAHPDRGTRRRSRAGRARGRRLLPATRSSDDGTIDDPHGGKLQRRFDDHRVGELGAGVQELGARLEDLRRRWLEPGGTRSSALVALSSRCRTGASTASNAASVTKNVVRYGRVASSARTAAAYSAPSPSTRGTVTRRAHARDAPASERPFVSVTVGR